MRKILENVFLNKYMLILYGVLFWALWFVFMLKDLSALNTILLGIVLLALLILEYRILLPHIDLSWTNLSKKEAVKRFIIGVVIASTVVIVLVYLFIKTGII